jgi:hypothetical protein
MANAPEVLSGDGGSTQAPSLQFSDLKFRPIPGTVAVPVVVEKHYAHAPCQVKWAWGIYHQDDLMGVLTIGKPPSWSSYCGVIGQPLKSMYMSGCCKAPVEPGSKVIPASKELPRGRKARWWTCTACSGEIPAGKDAKSSQKGLLLMDPKARSNDVYELNRLWLDDKLPRNTESKFIGWCLREVKKILPNAIIISHADGAQGHVGTVYKATNWVYTGTTTPFMDIVEDGYNDYRSVPNKVRGSVGANGKREWAERANQKRVVRSIKHRYVWTAQTEDRKLIAWKVQPYPDSPAKQTEMNENTRTA